MPRRANTCRRTSGRRSTRPSALWTRSPRRTSATSSTPSFYKAISYDQEAPLAWSHNRVEGSTEYTQLLYIPAKAPVDLWNRDKKAGVKLYVKRVFIMDEAEALMPSYLRWVKGVVDSADLPLNVSRELLQESRDVKAIREGNTRRVLAMLEDLARKDKAPVAAEGVDGVTDVVSEQDKAELSQDAGKYSAFYAEFGAVLKEGLGEDFANREKIAKAAALCLDPERQRQRGPGRLQGPHEGRPGGHLLHHRRQPGGSQNSPQLECSARRASRCC
jgi:molecular chaperone HtpG